MYKFILEIRQSISAPKQGGRNTGKFIRRASVYLLRNVLIDFESPGKTNRWTHHKRSLQVLWYWEASDDFV